MPDPTHWYLMQIAREVYGVLLKKNPTKLADWRLKIEDKPEPTPAQLEAIEQRKLEASKQAWFAAVGLKSDGTRD